MRKAFLCSTGSGGGASTKARPSDLILTPSPRIQVPPAPSHSWQGVILTEQMSGPHRDTYWSLEDEGTALWGAVSDTHL